MKKTIAISGGFDPVHIGHLNMIKGAAREGSVIVILNSDAWLEQKKGYVFMPFEERKAILEAFSDVHHVVEVDDSDGTVCEALDQLRPCYFGNGGDRVSDNVPEVNVCKELDVIMLWGIGGGKIQSSSWLIKNKTKTNNKNKK